MEWINVKDRLPDYNVSVLVRLRARNKDIDLPHFPYALVRRVDRSDERPSYGYNSEAYCWEFQRGRNDPWYETLARSYITHWTYIEGNS
jgi:hypothetical protein